jgi:hypothetical protein
LSTSKEIGAIAFTHPWVYGGCEPGCPPSFGATGDNKVFNKKEALKKKAFSSSAVFSFAARSGAASRHKMYPREIRQVALIWLSSVLRILKV